MMLSDLENFLSVWENKLLITNITYSWYICVEYCIKKSESVISSKIVNLFYIVIWFVQSSYHNIWASLKFISDQFCFIIASLSNLTRLLWNVLIHSCQNKPSTAQFLVSCGCKQFTKDETLASLCHYAKS